MTRITTLRSTSLTLAAGALSLAGSMAHAQTFTSNVIIQGSLCVGQDCVTGESFGFDTIRLKENNLRIKFQDTSTSASFPSNDWQIRINDSSNGGGNYYAVEDVTGGRTPFLIEAAAPSNSLYVEDGGRVGFGTSTPVVDLHVKKGNTPTLRLEQDGSSGFGAQTWDVAGNEANFFVRDATSGSTLPFRIFPGAPSNAISIEASGDIGLGTTSPAAPLHVLTAGTAAAQNANDDLIIQDTGPARLALVNTSATNTVWTLNSNDTLRISAGTDDTELELQANGNMELGGICIEFDANNASRFACTFSAGGGAVCAAAGSSCP